MNTRTFAAAAALLLAFPLLAADPDLCPPAGTPIKPPQGHPHVQPRPKPSKVTMEGDTIVIRTGDSIFPKPHVDPFTLPPGTNFLPTIYTNMYDSYGREMLNTLPSTPANPYNLHDGVPNVTEIDPTSPSDDLRAVLDKVTELVAKQPGPDRQAAISEAIQIGIDVLEGNRRPGRAYSGFPLLHYMGPAKVKPVELVRDANGNVVGGNVDIHQIWYDGHIETDTSFIDPKAVLDVPWTVTYTVDILNRGEDDFSPFVIYVDPVRNRETNQCEPLPHIGMDQTFFPMENGTRTVLKIRNAPARYFNMTYTWGWRNHPPRIQVTENALKTAKIAGQEERTLPEWEYAVFCPDGKACVPNSTSDLKERAIGMIGDLAPEKQMWLALRDALRAAKNSDYATVAARIADARASFGDFRDRTRLPRAGKYRVEADPQSDLTLLYVNNTIYAEFSDRSSSIDDAQRIDFDRWKLRGTALRVTIYNGDYFAHGYQNVDFGGSRGWENQFKSSVPLGGSGCWFTFGRAHWWANIPNTEAGELTVVVPAAATSPYVPSRQKVRIHYNYEPSRRLRFYQFDPLHHDVAIFSVH